MSQIELRGYQQHQNDAVFSAAKRGHRRIISCMATGSGKSIQMADLAQRALAKGKSVLILLPRRSLVLQLSESFTGWGINNGVIMSGIRPFTQPRVQIASIDTYLARMSAGRMEHLHADLLLIDEMHLQFTAKKLEVFKKYPMVVSFSATPIAPKKQSLGIFYQEIVETITMQQLMDQGYLTPLRCFSRPGIDLSGLKTDADGDYRESMLEGVMDKPELIGDIYANWHRLAAGKPTVIFASSQAHARHLCQQFNDNGWSFEYVDCTYTDEERQAIFERVRTSKTKGIVNVGIVSVGIDIPNLECVVLARPTRLVSVYLQCVGRVTRLSPGKHFGIVIDHAGIIERLGLPTDDFEWSLDGKESVEERAQRKKEEKKEPKQITCVKCETVFQSRRSCPVCGHQMIAKGEAIPCHEAELKEVKKASSLEKEEWYRQALGWCRRHNKKDGLAFYAYQDKWGVQPAWKKIATAPSEEVSNYFQHRAIKYARGKAVNR